jgi:hypothetical protein
VGVSERGWVAEFQKVAGFVEGVSSPRGIMMPVAVMWPEDEEPLALAVPHHVLAVTIKILI